jgi:hypothetical protein
MIDALINGKPAQVSDDSIVGCLLRMVQSDDPVKQYEATKAFTSGVAELKAAVTQITEEDMRKEGGE